MPRPRLWPALLALLLGTLWILKTWLTGDAIRQQRVMQTIATVALVVLALLVWLAFLSRLPRRRRLVAGGVALGLLALAPALVRVRGVTGDLRPIVELRWKSHAALPEPPRAPEPRAVASASPPPPAPLAPGSGLPVAPKPSASRAAATPEARGPAAPASLLAFPQFLGPSRDATLAGLRLARDWSARPPQPLWREPLGEAWSGFAIADGIAVTQEQRGGEERVVAYDRARRRALWSHADATRYATVIAGVGPRATPTIEAGRVFTLGATGILNALELASGRRLWSHDVVRETGATLPDWGKSASPLVVDGRVVVAGGSAGPRARGLRRGERRSRLVGGRRAARATARRRS